MITDVDAWEVLDSRGNPTVRVAAHTASERGVFTVPSGASTGAHEVLERRDGEGRYDGRGVREAVRAVRQELAPELVGADPTDQRAIDARIEDCDGTDNLSRLGGNAVLGVSGAIVHLASNVRDEPLYETLATETPGRLPRPMVNILSGGLHARGGVEIQDFLVVPRGATTYREALETAWAVRDAVRARIEADGHRPLVADEGGYAPPLDRIDDAFDLLERSVRDAGFEPHRDDVAFAVDVAASHFYDAESETYELSSVGRTLDRDELTDLVASWADRYPLVSVEDPLAEDDWAGWQRLATRLDGVQLLGDDLLVTDAARIERAIETGAANAVLVKPNQAGTITRAREAVATARDVGLATVVSARSGETSDTTIADLAVGLDAGQIKIGSLARSERLAKYNRLLEIDRELDTGLAADPIL
ncbi:phosphopyruvate hydratase [Haladaptatus sp. GCM10025707]|uniref:phosphopyruvate hydratase n=1 Tax=unclassified Haladaptatus TaxID=2622732 RepID=UPI0023E7DA4F|nr:MULTISPECIES: phosphopyruvate hydratase [unclassified Haladaptatus]